MQDTEIMEQTESADADIEKYTRALREKLNDAAMAYLERGNAYCDKKDYDKAIEDFTEAIRISLNLDHQLSAGLAYEYRSYAYGGKNDLRSAIADIDEAARLNPYNPYTHDAEKKRYQAVLDAAEALQANPNDPIAYSNRGYAYLQLAGDINNAADCAIADYTEALRLEPNYALFYFGRGEAYERKGELDKAIKDFTESIRLKYTDAYYDRGNIYVRIGELEYAIKDFTEAIRGKPMAAYFKRGETYWKKGDLDRAIEDYRTGFALLETPNREVCMLSAYEQWRIPSDLYVARADKRFENGEYDLAIEDYTEAVSLNPYRGNAFYKRGTAYALKGDEDSAFESFCDAIRVSDNLKARIARGAIYNKRERYEDAIMDFTEALRQAPDNSEAIAGLEEAKKRLIH